MIDSEKLSQIHSAIATEQQSSRRWYERAKLAPTGALKLCYDAIDSVRTQVNEAASSPEPIRVRALARKLEKNRGHFTEGCYDKDGFGISTYNALVRAIAALDPPQPRHNLVSAPFTDIVHQGHFLALGRPDSVELWDLKRGHRVERANTPGRALAWSINGTKLYTLVNEDYAPVEWSESTTELLRSEGSYGLGFIHPYRPENVARELIMPVKEYYWNEGDDREITDANGQTLWRIVAKQLNDPRDLEIRFRPIYRIRGYYQAGWTLAIDHHSNPDSSSISLWDLHTGRLIDAWCYYGSQLVHVSFSPDQEKLVTVTRELSVEIRDAGTGNQTRVRQQDEPAHDGRFDRLVWKSDSSAFATACVKGVVIVREAVEGRPLARLEHDDMAITSMSWNNGVLAVGIEDGWVQFYEDREFQEVGRLFSAPEGWIVVSSDGLYDGELLDEGFRDGVGVGLSKAVSVGGRTPGVLGVIRSARTARTS